MTEDSTAKISPQPTLGRYRDELNFAEFPLASVADSLPAGQKTLTFTDTVFDSSTKQKVPRTLTITAADKFGLPTAMDEEVLLGLMQLSFQKGLPGRRINFSRYELIKLLSWRDESKSYHRIEESLNRWVGVTLQYQKAWWSKEEQCWVNETFHVLEQLSLFDRERTQRRRQMAKDQPSKALSSFVWSETVFRSFEVGYIKSLDFDFYKGLNSAISKRMYRFLDKRFYHKNRLDFDLRTFACEHISLSKNYSNSQIKRKLLPAICELEDTNFLERMSLDERFMKVAPSQWRVVFHRKSVKLEVLPAVAEENSDLVQALEARGITAKSAKELVASNPRALIEEKLTFHDWLKSRGDARLSRNASGWLYKAIRENYAAPTDYLDEKARAEKRKEVQKRNDTRRVQETGEAKVKQDEASAKRAEFLKFWAALSFAEQEEFESKAVAAGPRFLVAQYEKRKVEQGSLWNAVREQLLVSLWRESSV